jgi:hypothetical protein
MKRRAKSSKKSKVFAVDSTNPFEGYLEDRALVEKIDPMIRLYFKRIFDEVSVYYRPSHEYLGSVKWDERGKDKVRRIISLSRDDFYKLIVRVPKTLSLNLYKEREDWFKGAWLKHTEDVLEELGISFDVLYENFPQDFRINICGVNF